MSKTIGGVKTTYLVDDVANPTGYAQVVEERINGVVQVAYGYGPMRAWAKYPAYQYGDANGQGADPARYYGYDGHGSVRVLTDEVGTVTDKYDYDAFGNIINQTSSPSGARDGWGRVITLPVANTMLFAGEQFDPDLGLYYNRARHLDVRVGRFWGMDTSEGGFHKEKNVPHMYAYADGNPVNRTDPSGLESADLAENLTTLPTIQTLAAVAAITLVGVCGAEVSFAFGMDALGYDAGNLPGPCAPERFKNKITLYHYTALPNVDKITNSMVLWASLGEMGDAVFGTGQYFTDIKPSEASTRTKGQLGYALYMDGRKWNNSEVGYIGVNISPSSAKRRADVYGGQFPGKGIYLRQSTTDLRLSGRLADWGAVTFISPQ